MVSYWLGWIFLTLGKLGMLTLSTIGAVGGITHFSEYGLLVIFIPVSLWLLYDMIYQLLVPWRGGKGNQLHKPTDTPMYIGLAPSYKEAREIIKKGQCIIWD